VSKICIWTPLGLRRLGFLEERSGKCMKTVLVDLDGFEPSDLFMPFKKYAITYKWF